MKISIIHSTKKAHLVEDSQGRKGWLMNRSVKNGDTVVEKTFLKAVERFATAEVAKKERDIAKKAERELMNSFMEVTPDFETEKAVLLKVEAYEESTDQQFVLKAWLPKSMLQDGKAPVWMVNKKLTEEIYGLKNRFNGGCFEAYIGDLRIAA